ncbi:MAG: hypothetical protein ACYTEZ_12580 [Planctomycetota bacterium]|jgi:hypothetical protein
MTCPDAALATKPTFGRFVYYKALTLIPVFTALVAIARYSRTWSWPLVYVGLCLLHAGIMYTIKCPHCAYYKMGGAKHRCFIWWGVPKVYAPRPGPEPRLVGIYAPIGMLVLTLFPVYWLRFQWELLLLYLWSVGVLAASITLNECTRCLHFDCAHNRVPEEVRRGYLEPSA